MYISHEDYNKKAEDYDKNRRAVELDLVIAEIKKISKRLNKPVEEMVLGDFGCGTGNYVQVLMKQFNFKKIIGVEMNDGMIKVFRRKFEDNKNVQLYKQSLFDMDLDGQMVDLAIMNQVGHHLDTQKKTNTRVSLEFPNLEKVVSNISKFVIPGGEFLINFSTPLQSMKGVWYVNYLYPAKSTLVTYLRIYLYPYTLITYL